MPRPLALVITPFLAACASGAASSPPPAQPAASAALSPAPPLVPSTAAPEAAARAAPPAPVVEPVRAPETLDLPAVDAWVGKQVEQQGLVGLSLAIVRDGKVVFAKGYGQASREGHIPVDTSTAFAVGSVTKQFACAAALLLAQTGKLSMTDKVSKYYPELPRANVITLADLGAHVSGYPDYDPLDFLDSRIAHGIAPDDLIKKYAAEPLDFEPGTLAHGIAPDDLIKKYAAEPLDFEPGTRWSYSNTGFILLGRVLEKVSGRPFGQLLAERIIRPLGLEHTSFAPPDGAPGIARGYESFALGEPRPAPREPESWAYAAGALYASATDLAT